MGFKVALPYLPGMKFGMNAFAWKGIDGMKDKKGRKYTLGGNLSDNLSLNYIRTDYKDAATKDTDSIALNLHLELWSRQTRSQNYLTSQDQAYELTKLGA